MKFIDEARITVRAGKGGAGAVSFRREAYVPKGGPDGGDGGKGGDVVLRASAQLQTLEDIALHPIYRASNGNPGEGSRKSGRDGRGIILELPVGTVIRDADTGQIMADLAEDGESLVIARGGRGGKGNARFATSRIRAPRKAEPGQPAEERRLELELKLISDVGLVGRPNAGKSTLLSALTRAHPRVASYPFTTLSPALGVIYDHNYRRLVIADIPGLAKGARYGRGLGHRFLKHIERTRLIVMLIEAPERDYRAVHKQLLEELAGWKPALIERPRLIVLSKSDLRRGDRHRFPFDLKISSVSGAGLTELAELLFQRLQSETAAENQ